MLALVFAPAWVQRAARTAQTTWYVILYGLCGLVLAALAISQARGGFERRRLEGDGRVLEAAKLLRAVADGAMSAAAAWAQWPFGDEKTNTVVDAANHCLYHFHLDADVRGRDPGYSEAQIADLRSLADKLEREFKP